MTDIDIKLENFKNDCEKLNSSEFNNFYEMEKAYCNLINVGNSIRFYIKDNPSVCDENSYKVLTNQSGDLSLLDDKFKCLLNIVSLSKILFDKYGEYVISLIKEKQYEEAINIYEQMFKFSNNWWYKKEIANIYYQIFNDIPKAIKMYKEIEPHMSNDKTFWWQFSQIYKDSNAFYREVLCMQKAVKLELKELGENS